MPAGDQAIPQNGVSTSRHSRPDQVEGRRARPTHRERVGIHRHFREGAGRSGGRRRPPRPTGVLRQTGHTLPFARWRPRYRWWIKRWRARQVVRGPENSMRRVSRSKPPRVIVIEQETHGRSCEGTLPTDPIATPKTLPECRTGLLSSANRALCPVLVGQQRENHLHGALPVQGRRTTLDA